MEYVAKSNQSVANVVQFIENTKNLKKATFLNSNADIRDTILEQLKPEWTIVIEGDACIFLRFTSLKTNK